MGEGGDSVRRCANERREEGVSPLESGVLGGGGRPLGGEGERGMGIDALLCCVAEMITFSPEILAKLECYAYYHDKRYSRAF